MKSRFSHLAIAQFVGAGVLALIALALFRSSYYHYFLQSNLREAQRNYYSGPTYYENALVYLEDAQKESPDYGPLYNLFGAIFLHPKKKRLSRAKENYENALKYGLTNEDKYVAHIGLALYWLDKALSLDRKEGSQNSKIREKKKNFFESAEEELDKAAQYSGNNKDHLLYLWALYAIQDKQGKGESLFKEIQDLLNGEEKDNIPSRGSLITYFYELGLYLFKKKKFKESIKFFRTALRLDPKNTRISKALAYALVGLLQREKDSPKKKEEDNYLTKLKDILLVEECLALSLERFQRNLLGLDPFLDVLLAELAYSYSELAVLMSHKYGWFGDFEGLNQRYKEQLIQLKCEKVSLFKKRVEQLFKQAYLTLKRNRNHSNLSELEYLLFQAKAATNWIKAAPKQFKNNYYLLAGSIYKRIGQLNYLDPSLRSQAYINEAYFNLKVKKYKKAEYNVNFAMKFDKTNPLGYYNLATALDKSKIPRYKKKAMIYYKKSIEVFKKALAGGKKFPSSILDLKKKMEMRLQSLEQ